MFSLPPCEMHNVTVVADASNLAPIDPAAHTVPVDTDVVHEGNGSNGILQNEDEDAGIFRKQSNKKKRSNLVLTLIFFH